LTRQDWRGPLASWIPGGLGYWEVDVRTTGSYELTLLFPEIKEGGKAWAKLGGLKSEVDVSPGEKSAAVTLKGVGAGITRAEAGLELGGKAAIGPYYLNVKHVGAG
jgi:hypothetical protein